MFSWFLRYPGVAVCCSPFNPAIAVLLLGDEDPQVALHMPCHARHRLSLFIMSMWMCLASVRRKLRWRTPSYCRHVKVKICQDPLLTGNMLKHVSDRNGKPLQTAGALPKCLGNSEKLLKEFDLICNSLNKASTLLPACAESIHRAWGGLWGKGYLQAMNH